MDFFEIFYAVIHAVLSDLYPCEGSLKSGKIEKSRKCGREPDIPWRYSFFMIERQIYFKWISQVFMASEFCTYVGEICNSQSSLSLPIHSRYMQSGADAD